MTMFGTIRPILVALALLAAAALPAYAQNSGEVPPKELEAARTLLEVTDADQQFSVVLPMMFRQMRQALPPPPPDKQEEFDKVFAEVEKLFIARRGEVIDQIAMLYARTFTADEMNKLTAFYRSPVGRKFIDAMPKLAAEAMQIGNVWGQRIAREAEQTIREELKKRGLDL